MTDELRVAVLGYGLAGRVFHAPLINATPGLALSTIVTSNPTRQDQARRDFPTARVLGGADEVWAAASDYDVAVIATANAAHVPQAKAALDAGLHTVVDKPLAGTEQQALDLMAHASRAGRQLFVFQNRRLDGDFLTAKMLIESGELGRVHRFESRFERFRPRPTGGWRERGAPEQLPGLLFDLGAHLVDQALLLLGPADSVFASARQIRDDQTADDDTQVLIHHSSGAISMLWASAIAAFTNPRMRVLGTLGGYEVDGLDGQEDDLRNGISPLSESYGQTARTGWGALVKLGDNGEDARRVVPTLRGQWPQFYADVVASIHTGIPQAVSASDVLGQLRVLSAAQRSAVSGQVVPVTSAAAS
jgi:scyllo-inositol 2-dehydrogenase (NADP+)